MNPIKSIKDLVGFWIKIRLVADFPSGLKGDTTGVYSTDGWINAKLTGVDEIGIWLDNPNVTDFEYKDSKGNWLPEEQRKKVSQQGWVLIRWNYIVGVVCTDQEENMDSKNRLGFPLPNQSQGDVNSR